MNGTVERPLRAGYVSRTYVTGGRALYARVYRERVFGPFAYEAVVPAVVFPAAYYAWAVRPWGPPVVFQWGWAAQPWYGVYGVSFTPYPYYTSLDLWMTDYVIAQNLQLAYQAATAPPPPPAAPPPAGAAAPPPPPAPAPSAPSAAPAPAANPDPASKPPVLTADAKAQLNAEIKVQIQDQQNTNTTPPAQQDIPSALKRGHVFFRVVSSLDVDSTTPNQACSLQADDYIQRIGTINSADGTVPVEVKVSAPADCPQGLKTHIPLNDLMVMENEQEAQVATALQAASKNMGPNGLPSTPDARAILFADGQASPDPGAVQALQQVQ
jgi:hypothetical protein